jgi:hypothetical protein
MDYLADGFINSTRYSLRNAVGKGDILEGVVNVLLGYGCTLPILIDVVKACLAEVDDMRGMEAEEQKVNSVLNILGCIVQSVEGEMEEVREQVKRSKSDREYLEKLLERYGDDNVVLGEGKEKVEDGEIEGFFKDYHDKKGKGDEEETKDTGEGDEEEMEKEKADNKVASEQSRILREVLSRCCYYLPLPSLSTAVASFAVATKCFEALKKIGNSDGTGDPLLMAINDVWATVLSSVLTRRGLGGGKQKSKGRAFLEVEGDASNIVNRTLLKKTYYDSPSGQDSRLGFEVGDTETKERILFTHLFELTAYLCREAGDFMARRVDEVFNLGGLVLKRQGAGAGSGRKAALILAAIDCFCAIFENCGEGVAGKVELATAMVVGWLSDKGDVGSKAEECCKIMCKIDIEGAYEGLVKGGGERGEVLLRWMEEGGDVE